MTAMMACMQDTPISINNQQYCVNDRAEVQLRNAFCLMTLMMFMESKLMKMMRSFGIVFKYFSQVGKKEPL